MFLFLCSSQDYGRICIEINMQKNRRVLFEYCDPKGQVDLMLVFQVDQHPTEE